MDFFKVSTFEYAKQTIADLFSIDKLPSELVTLDSAVGRRAAADIISNEDSPDYNRSVVDGYAVKAFNTYGATDSVPAMLKVVGRVTMGVVGGVAVGAGEAVYVPTGGAVPEGADAMVMIEDVELFGDDIAVYKPATVFSGMIRIGDDIKKGERLINRGDVITPLACGMLAAVGIDKLECYRKPRVAIISSGDEIVAVADKHSVGEIRDVNATVCATMCEENGFQVTSICRVKDDFDELEHAVFRGVDESDIVIISGGSSIGAKDYTERVIEKNGDILIHGIALKPGKPTIIGKIGEKAVFGLPGHPMACLLCLKLLVIDAISGVFDKEERFIYAKASINFPSSPGRLTVQPVELQFNADDTIATPVFYKSGLVSVLARANGYILIPINQEGIQKGERVKVYLL